MRRIRIYPTIDLYFARTYLKFVVLVFVAVCMLLVIGDFSQRADEFFKYGSKSGRSLIVVAWMIAHYYLTLAPSMVLRYMLPLILMLAGAFTITYSLVHNEYVVIRSSGISLQRSMGSMLLLALTLCGLLALTQDWYLPYLIRQSNSIASEIKKKDANRISLVLRDGRTIQSISMGHFDFKDNQYIAHNLRIETRNAKQFFDGMESFEAYTAWEAYLQPRTDIIDMEEGDERELQWTPRKQGRHYNYSRFSRRKTPWKDPVPTYVTPAMLERHALGEAVMTWSDLSRLANEELVIRIEMHRRVSAPFAYVVLLMAGLSIMLALTARGGEPSYVINIVIAIVVALGFYLIRAHFLAWGEAETLPPILAAWLPVALIGGITGWLSSKLGT